MGATGLSGALPGGDGRAALAYRSEFRGYVLQGVDALVDRFQEGWRRDDLEELGRVYEADAWVVTPDGRLVVGFEAITEWLDRALPATGTMITGRDDFTASGEMAYIQGRYEASAGGGSQAHSGIHLTVIKRHGRDWRIRAQLFLPAEGMPDAVASTAVAAHITPDDLRVREGRVRRAQAAEVIEWMVDSYLEANSLMSLWRDAWLRDDVRAALAMLTPEAKVRIPWDVPVVGSAAVQRSLTRFLPAVGALSMSIQDFDASERISYCLGRYHLTGSSGELGGYYLAVIRKEDDGSRLRALVFGGAGLGPASLP
jgi:ketosteroid isomerase-like protein